MTELTLKDGRVINVDISELTVLEWRKFAGPLGTVKDENAAVSKCTGLTTDEIEKMNYQEFRRVVKAIIKDAQSPLADPS